ncbi:MAG: AraC family transcriptional regulator [Bryobacterales bacterium]|nr:AraC family transcriptional regulator [Bryobacterales bacterium]
MYREYPPPPHLRDSVECFWTSRAESRGPHRVYPDGCMDLMYSREGGKSRLEGIGAMTRFADAEAEPGTEIFAVRFRPAGLLLPLPAEELRDAAADWFAVHPGDARLLKSRLDNSEDAAQMIEVCAAVIPPPKLDPVQKAIAELERQHGVLDLDWLARQTSLGERQFRRLCLARTGLAPKQLARVLRFRRALNALRQARRGGLTALALECGYYDQAHFIHDFRALAGTSPVRFLQSSSHKGGLPSDHENHSSSHDGPD